MQEDLVMGKDRLHQGLDKLMEYTLTDNKEISTHLKIADELKDIAPDVSKYIIEFAYGDIYSRPGLTTKEVVEAIIQLIPYTGFPRVLNALTIAKKVFTQRHIKVSTPGVTEK